MITELQVANDRFGINSAEDNKLCHLGINRFSASINSDNAKFQAECDKCKVISGAVDMGRGITSFIVSTRTFLIVSKHTPSFGHPFPKVISRGPAWER